MRARSLPTSSLPRCTARLGEHLPELNLAHLAGRVGWRSDASRREIFTRGLVFETTEGKRLGPTDLKLLLTDVAGRNASGRLEFDRLELGPLRDLAVHLPLPEGIRKDIEYFSPRGTVSHANLRWEDAAEAPLTFSAAADFAELGVLPHDAFPGVTGLSGRFEATQAKGELKIASRNVALALPDAVSGGNPVRHGGGHARLGAQIRADRRADPEARVRECRFRRQRSRNLPDGRNRRRQHRPERPACACRSDPTAPVPAGCDEGRRAPLDADRARAAARSPTFD